MKKLKLTFAATIIAAGLMIAGCGGTQPSNPTDTPAETDTVAASTAEPVTDTTVQDTTSRDSIPPR